MSEERAMNHVQCFAGRVGRRWDAWNAPCKLRSPELVRVVMVHDMPEVAGQTNTDMLEFCITAPLFPWYYYFGFMRVLEAMTWP